MQSNELNKIRSRNDMILYINLKLIAMGQPVLNESSISGAELLPNDNTKLLNLAENLIQNYRERTRQITNDLCPADTRIQNFINAYLHGVKFQKTIRIPENTLVLDQKGMAREVSLSPKFNVFQNEHIKSFRIKQGVLHNPKSDRRTTVGTFHIVEGGLPVPYDKIEVPRITFAHLLYAALNPPADVKELPFTHGQSEKAKLFTSLYLRPLVSPKVEDIMPEKRMEIRFFAPGGLVSNLDFVEQIFGNAGDPYLSENDAALDFEHWTGHTGCIILAPHLVGLKKKDIGLPKFDDATERQKRDGMCWKLDNELYNGGNAFKITCRNETGVVITILADNYFGYSKKEIKTQISFSANLFGLAEEEHAGGAVAIPRKNLGETFSGDLFNKKLQHGYSFEEVKKIFGNMMDIQPENYAMDKIYPNIFYIPENAHISLYEGFVIWDYKGETKKIKLKPGNFYIHPSGYKLHMEKHPAAPSWRLVSTYPEGLFCHKPCTVSGGGKSEISKSLTNNIIYDSFYIHDKEMDFELVDRIFTYDFSNRWKNHEARTKPSRPILDSQRSLGSVVKLLTPTVYNTDEYNEFLNTIPEHVKGLVLFIKRFYRPERDGKSWRDYFSVHKINGREGHALLYNERPIKASYLRIGFDKGGSWYLNKLRSDFIPAAKLQMEDDITASIVLPASRFEHLNPLFKNQSIKITENCEASFFQRPDDAIHRGFDVQAEADMSKDNIFTTNYEPLTAADAKDLIDDAIGFDKYTEPIKNIIRAGAQGGDDSYFISPSHPRMVDGKPTKNPRYLQHSTMNENPMDLYLATVGLRFHRKIPLFKPVHFPVNSMLAGRRNNPPDTKKGIRSLSVYNPIHYQQLPELFMDFVCSLTGKSPSTTGAGSEGALTKGPFNMLSPTTDLNNALLSFILTGYDGYTTAAGYIGTENRFDHDISILIPELWCRIQEEVQDTNKLITEGCFEKLEDFDYNGQRILASRLGYRMTNIFMFRYFGRIFDEPQTVFTEKMLKPELQDMEAFVDGINNIVEAQRNVALNYFADGSIAAAIPPLKVLLHIMAHGNYEGKDISDPELRQLFTREYVINSDWYKERLLLFQKKEIALLEQKINYANNFMSYETNEESIKALNIKEKVRKAEHELEHIKSDKYLQSLIGTIGSDVLYK